MKKQGVVDYLNRRDKNNEAQAATSLVISMLSDRIEGESYNGMQADTDLLICKRCLEKTLSDLEIEGKEIMDAINSLLADKGILCE